MCFLKWVVCAGGVLRHSWHSPNPEGYTEEGEHGFAHVCEGFRRIVGVVVEHGNEEVVGSESFCHLHDNGELVDEEVVGRVDDDGDVVEMVFANEVVVGAFAFVLAKGTCESWTEGGHPAVE